MKLERGHSVKVDRNPNSQTIAHVLTYTQGYVEMGGTYWYFVLNAHTNSELLTAQRQAADTTTENDSLKEGE